MPDLDSFARIPTGPRSRPQDTVRNLSAKGFDASAVGSLLRLSMGGEPIGYDDLIVDRLHVGSRGVYLLTRDVDSPNEASLSFVPHEDVLAGLPGFDKTWPSAQSEPVASYECEDFLEPQDSDMLRDVGGHTAAGAPHPRAAEVAAAFAALAA